MPNRSDISSQDKSTRPAVRRIADEVLGDGVIVELVRGESEAAQPQLLIWNGAQARIADRFKLGDVTYGPIRLAPTVARGIRLPRGIADYGSTRKLFDEVSTLLAGAARLSDDVVTQLAFFVFATWLADFLPVAPFLWVYAPFMVPREPLLQLLRSLCRHVMTVNEFSMATLRSLPMQLRPTVICEAVTSSRSMLAALRASNRQGICEAAGGKVRDLYCAKIICAHQPLTDSTMGVLPLEVALMPAGAQLRRMDAEETERVAAEFQPKLLRYRLLNQSKVVAPNLDVSGLTPPVQELAQSLAMSIVGDPELQSRIVPLLKPVDAEIRVDAALLLESIVLEALLAACHDNSMAATLTMSNLTRAVNTILVGRGELRQVSPEVVGWKLRTLGLRTSFIAGGRKGLDLVEATRVRIHRLAEGYGVRSLRQDSVQRCPLCVHVMAATSHPGGPASAR